MIVGIGIDIVEVSRIGERVSSGTAFKSKVFSSEEIAYCESCSDPAQHFAARFAAKEAFLKAAGDGLAIGFDLCDVAVLSYASGQPFIDLRNHFKTLAKENNWKSILVSLSHVREHACAVVTIES